MAKGKGSFWAAGFQDDLNKDKYQSLPPYVWIWIDKIWKQWQMVKAPFELLVSKMISIKMYQSLPPYVWFWIDKIWKTMAKGKGSFWAAGFQDDLNKDVSITTALCLNFGLTYE